ncbi:MAG: MarC family protein [Dehalococcoidales bacterium]|nr:MarC family protein [Dehalococcoidales bacterium]
MPEWLNSLLLSVVPIFIVIDALGNLPVVVSLSEDLNKYERRKMIHIASLTAGGVGLVFLFFGQWILNLMGISVGAFAVAGGLILFALSTKYIITGRMVDAVKEEMMAVVPIGTPLLVGPATITTLLLLNGQYPLYIVLIAFIINIIVAWGILLLGNGIAGFMGKGGLKAVSKIFNLLLAAIAVTMILRGLSMLGVDGINLG